MTGLSPRQNEILKLVAQGHPNKTIAYPLGVSEKTVRNQLTSVFRKLNVQCRTQVAIWLVQHNLNSNYPS